MSVPAPPPPPPPPPVSVVSLWRGEGTAPDPPERRATHDCAKPPLQRMTGEDDVQVRFRCPDCGQRWRGQLRLTLRHGYGPWWRRVGPIRWYAGGWR